MKVGYSKLLISENVVPDLGASWQITALDWFMMGFAASRERTEVQWGELLELAGLPVVGIWTKEAHVESLIEAALEEWCLVDYAVYTGDGKIFVLHSFLRE